MADTLGTNNTGYSYPGATYWRKGVYTLPDEALWMQTADRLVLAPFIGKEGSGLPFITKNETVKKKTDTIRLEMGGRLTGMGVFGNKALEGAEVAIPQYYADVYVNQIRQAWKDDGEMSRFRSRRDLKAMGIKALGTWMAEQIERYIFNAIEFKYAPNILSDIAYGYGYGVNTEVGTACKNWFCADGSNNNPTYSATPATFTAAISAAEVLLTNSEEDFFGPNVLEGVANKTKTLFFDPVQYKGFSGTIGFIHPNQTSQLRKNSDWFLANIHAMPPGENNNPIFTGRLANMAVGMWGDIMLFESTLVHSGNLSYYTDLLVTQSGNAQLEIDSNAASVYRAIFCGANAMAIAEAVALHLEYKDDFDYNDKTGVACSSILGIQRPDFTSDDSNATLINQSSMVVSTYSPAAQT